MQTLFREYPSDFFDLIIVDECHRGSARQESAWHAILKHFEPAAQLGLTATPKRDTNVDTYEYFGEPIYEYSLRQGIKDRYLAPYRIRRVVLSVDTDGWRPSAGQVDEKGQAIPDREYRAPDFERTLVLRERTRAVALHLASILGRTPTHRAIIFCVDSDHADRMRQELGNALPELLRKDPEWVVRIVAAEPRAQSFLERFADPETRSPVVATTSQMLSTGVDVEDLRYVILFRTVGSMVEFKQIVGRGTRIHPASGKTDFEIIDYVGATTHFADPAFDGPAQKVVRRKLRDDGGEDPVDEDEDEDEDEDDTRRPADPTDDELTEDDDDLRRRRDRFLVSGQRVDLVGELFYVHDVEGQAPRLVQYVDYAAEQVRLLTPDFEALRVQWSRYPTRLQVEQGLAERGIDLQRLAELTDLGTSDPLDVLAHVAWRLTPETRADRARRVRAGSVGELSRYAAPAREVLEALLDRYADYGVNDVADPHSLQLPPVRDLGSLGDLAARFGGAAKLHQAVDELQAWLYSA
jgi:type I restriction enzyme R subunit